MRSRAGRRPWPTMPSSPSARNRPVAARPTGAIGGRCPPSGSERRTTVRSGESPAADRRPSMAGAIPSARRLPPRSDPVPGGSWSRPCRSPGATGPDPSPRRWSASRSRPARIRCCALQPARDRHREPRPGRQRPPTSRARRRPRPATGRSPPRTAVGWRELPALAARPRRATRDGRASARADRVRRDAPDLRTVCRGAPHRRRALRGRHARAARPTPRPMPCAPPSAPTTSTRPRPSRPPGGPTRGPSTRRRTRPRRASGRPSRRPATPSARGRGARLAERDQPDQHRGPRRDGDRDREHAAAARRSARRWSASASRPTRPGSVPRTPTPPAWPPASAVADCDERGATAAPDPGASRRTARRRRRR